MLMTISSALFSYSNGLYVAFLIIGIALFKFLGVVFQYMELKKAHPFWKYLVVLYIVLFAIIIIVV